MSSFESKTSQAAKLLKGKMGLPETEVSSGAPFNAGPPPGSYAAQAREQQIRQVEAQRQAQAEELARIPQPVGSPPPQLPEDAVADGGEPVQPAPLESDPNLSQRARSRIEELARERREFERQASEASVERAKLTKQNEALSQQLNKLQEEFHAMLQANLDHLDPEARTRVMTEASARQAAAAAQEQIMAQMEPVLQQIRANQFQMELHSLSQRYQAFDYNVHADKIAATVRANPSLSVEQAFRAIASDEELGVSASRQIPTALPPRGSRGTEHVAPPPPKDPNLDLIEERNQWKDLARSSNPDDKKRADQLLQSHLKSRLGLK